ncbi:shikimate kinase [Scytonema hofmannii FACHB-248]|uniref:Shikimate kinase n=1 Tax=Scytonema hofmannii FACHB-248 TaxID=1842502 RepID=A0ABR8H0W9_9CYAN|nr:MULTISPECIES: shikimate kinase [Nostocales]MBD2609149.1 shikimate kinase [Scytonema hofmannii FACHB-248]
MLKGVNLYLIGMMGAGKTTVGRELAKQLRYGFLDADNVIEETTKQSINQLFALEGEAGFRQIESDVLAQICSFTKLVISTGGGVILQQKNWSYLRHGLIVWLDVPVELLCTRLALDTTRPLLQDVDLKQKLRSLLEQRQSLYNQADLRISVSDEETPTKTATRVLEAIPTVLKQATDVET